MPTTVPTFRAACRAALKRLALGVATAAAAPEIASYYLRSLVMGRDRALEGSTQLLSLVPGVPGQYLRRAFLMWAVDECHPTVTVEFLTVFSKAGVRLKENVYVGARCQIGLAELGKDVLIAPAVHIPSGGRTHGTAAPGVPIREQEGERKRVVVGAGAWVGTASVVMADVGADSVVGAGSVVTKPVPPGTVAAGVPAKVIRER